MRGIGWVCLIGWGIWGLVGGMFGSMPAGQQQGVLASSHRPRGVKPAGATPPATTTYWVYLPVVQHQPYVPGALSLVEVYTTDYGENRRQEFQPCQAIVLWVRIRNQADIPQSARLSWQTRDPQEQSPTYLQHERQVTVPPGDSLWRFVGSVNRDGLPGNYPYRVGFTSGVDQQVREGILTIAGTPMSFHYLGGRLAAVDPQNYVETVRKINENQGALSVLPIRYTDTFTFADSDVIEIGVWEGVTEESYIKTRRYRPDGRSWGSFGRQIRSYVLQPSCVYRTAAFWPVSDDVKQTPGQWRFDIFAAECFGCEEILVDQMHFIIREALLEK